MLVVPTAIFTYMAARFLIYVMFDPRTGQMRYVGKSCSGLKRPLSEQPRSVRGFERGHKSNWLNQLASLGLKPGIEVLQEVSDPMNLPKAERRWIAYFREMGCPLTNLTDGGEGAWGRLNSAETKLKMSASARFKRYGKSSELNRARVARDYLSGLSMRAVAKLHDTSSSMVCKILRKLSIPFRSKTEARTRIKPNE